MREPGTVKEVYLRPGELHFGGADTRIHTLLGSCVALVFWHPHRLLGGMCHFLLPTRSKAPLTRSQLDGHYGDEALALLLQSIQNVGAHPSEFTLRIFGGGNMFPGIARNEKDHIGLQNVKAAKRLLQAHGLVCSASHVEGLGHRRLFFSIWDGQVRLEQSPPALPVLRPRERT
ncbi:chemotaxis protein CheD [Pseudomonas duriflava]|uniref:Probable chemoreceptor glutamine deamidase CheD n=1 Tax=Pseudomonas duriflava TaxID=459528 RepID=A0A562QDN4_9PSED|nr:chemotaxis protein CheD [Pseudomonas duriflava]TWI54858.1 chemotaxis protein CheD [Pseudomonas duriflava]